MPSVPLAETRAVTKRFGSATAVDRVSISVGAGEVVGLLGANGAGKSTLIRLLLGLIQPSAGAISLFGSAPSIATRCRVGYVPQTLGLYDDLTVEENWAFMAAAFGTGAAGGKAFGPRVAEEIAGWGGELVGRLPLGVQRRVAFALALGHRPELLVLDEPTSGVGPLGRARLWERIRASAEHELGVLVSTHNMEEAEQCDRLVVLADGKMAITGTVETIVAGRTVTELRTGDWQHAYLTLDAAGFDVQVHGDVLRVRAPAADVAGVLMHHGIDARTSTVPANLEESFIAAIAGDRAA